MKKKYKYIAMVETTNGKYREQFAEGRDGKSLTSSARWTDARLRSSKKSAAEQASKMAAGFTKKEKAKPFVRVITFEDEI